MLVCLKSAGSLLTSSRLQQILESSWGAFWKAHCIVLKILERSRGVPKRQDIDDRKTKMHWKDMKVYIRKDRKLLGSFWRAFGLVLESFWRGFGELR